MTSLSDKLRVEPGTKVQLSKYDPSATPGMKDRFAETHATARS